MGELLNKLSSYNVFNYLLPGVVFSVLASEILHYPLLQHDIVVGAFVYYFIGLAVSRFGSLVVEPTLKCLSFVRFAEYTNFVVASKRDDQVEVLSEANNTYRTFCSLFSLLLMLKLYSLVEGWIPSLRNWDPTLLAVLLLVLFLFSYRKQTAYVAKRVNIAVSERTVSSIEEQAELSGQIKAESKKAGT